MATRLALGDVDTDGALDLVVGRVYGDDFDAPGDAFVLALDGTRRPIPVVGGVRGLAIAPDGAVWLGDGWDRDYGRKARARLSQARHSVDKGFQTQLVEDVVGQSWIDDIQISDLDGDETPEVVVRTNEELRIYTGSGETWRGIKVAGVVSDFALGDVDEVPGAEIVLLGEPPEIIAWR